MDSIAAGVAAQPWGDIGDIVGSAAVVLAQLVSLPLPVPSPKVPFWICAAEAGTAKPTKAKANALKRSDLVGLILKMVHPCGHTVN